MVLPNIAIMYYLHVFTEKILYTTDTNYVCTLIDLAASSYVIMILTDYLWSM